MVELSSAQICLQVLILSRISISTNRQYPIITKRIVAVATWLRMKNGGLPEEHSVHMHKCKHLCTDLVFSKPTAVLKEQYRTCAISLANTFWNSHVNGGPFKWIVHSLLPPCRQAFRICFSKQFLAIPLPSLSTFTKDRNLFWKRTKH